jgi:hypothetical protein
MKKRVVLRMSNSICGVLVAAFLWSWCVHTEAQVLPPPPQLGNPADASGHRPGDEPGEMQREMMAKLVIKRNEARQQQIVKDTSRLLALATELKSEVDKTNKDVLSIDVIRKADEIEKLSKSIKEHMKD